MIELRASTGAGMRGENMAATTEARERVQSDSHERRISRLEGIIETVLPYLATKEDVARSEMKIIMWVVGTVIGTGISVALALGGLLIVLLD